MIYFVLTYFSFMRKDKSRMLAKIYFDAFFVQEIEQNESVNNILAWPSLSKSFQFF